MWRGTGRYGTLGRQVRRLYVIVDDSNSHQGRMHACRQPARAFPVLTNHNDNDKSSSSGNNNSSNSSSSNSNNSNSSSSVRHSRGC